MIPRKRFAQHFLSDHRVIDHILLALSPAANQHLLEIGPGQGALTLPVLKIAKKLTVIELDRDLIEPLKARCKNAGTLEIYNEDVLQFDFNNLKSLAPIRVFGNLPYNISTPLMFHLLEYKNLFSEMFFMVQKEVALRLVAKENDDHYGRLSVMLQYHATVTHLFNVSKEAFYPPPQVESSIIKIEPFKMVPFPTKNYERFSEVVRLAFNQRRKTIRNSLKTLVNDQDFQALKIPSDLRAENLSVKDYVEISNQIS